MTQRNRNLLAEFFYSLLYDALNSIFPFEEINERRDFDISSQTITNNRVNENIKYLEFLAACNLPLDRNSYWWVSNPKRAVKEITLMANNTNAKMFRDNEWLIWEEEIINNFGTHFVISIETKNFPYRMPSVFVIEPKFERNQLKHIWGNGSLCIVTHDSYNTKMSILKFRNLGAVWCFGIEVYLNTGEWPALEHY